MEPVQGLDLVYHELAHVLAATLQGATATIFDDDDGTWQVTYSLPPGVDCEIAAARVWAAGALVPMRLSGQDVAVIRAMPQAMFEAAFRWCFETVLPQLMAVDKDEALAIARAMAEHGRVEFKSRMLH